MIGKKVIVRTVDGGVFFGTLAARNGQEVELTHARRLWYWSGACSTAQISADGVANPEDCKFTVWVERILILNAGDILPCTDKAACSIEGVKVWRYEHAD